MYEVRAIFRTDNSIDTLRFPDGIQKMFGPFKDRDHAERTVASLAARPDVISAEIVTHESLIDANLWSV